MPLVGSYIIPNNPFLLPGLAGDVQSKTVKTRQTIKEVYAAAAAAKPDIFFIVTQAEKSHTNYKLLLGNNIKYQFAEWGDLSTIGEVKCAVGETYRLKESLETNFNLPLVSENELSYRVTVPHILMSSDLKEIPIIHLTLPQDLDYDDLLKLSHLVLDFIQSSQSRIILLVAGEMGSRQPGVQQDAQVFDQYLMNYLQKNDLASLFNLNNELRSSCHQTIWGPTVFMLALLQPFPHQTKVISYDTAMNIGWLVAATHLND